MGRHCISNVLPAFNNSCNVFRVPHYVNVCLTTGILFSCQILKSINVNTYLLSIRAPKGSVDRSNMISVVYGGEEDNPVRTDGSRRWYSAPPRTEAGYFGADPARDPRPEDSTYDLTGTAETGTAVLLPVYEPGVRAVDVVSSSSSSSADGTQNTRQVIVFNNFVLLIEKKIFD